MQTKKTLIKSWIKILVFNLYHVFIPATLLKEISRSHFILNFIGIKFSIKDLRNLWLDIKIWFRFHWQIMDAFIARLMFIVEHLARFEFCGQYLVFDFGLLI